MLAAWCCCGSFWHPAAVMIDMQRNYCSQAGSWQKRRLWTGRNIRAVMHVDVLSWTWVFVFIFEFLYLWYAEFFLSYCSHFLLGFFMAIFPVLSLGVLSFVMSYAFIVPKCPSCTTLECFPLPVSVLYVRWAICFYRWGGTENKNIVK